jgi:TonB-dependent starch-binding outer membrane protein SusC
MVYSHFKDDFTNFHILSIQNTIFMKNKHLRQIMFLVLTVLSFGATAQSRKVTGKVAEGGGQGIPGASVIIKGSTTGTTTNASGEFSVNVKDDNAILQISSVGMNV